MPVVTISRQFGAGGHTLGVDLAKRLDYRILDRDIVGQVAERANVSTKFAKAVEKEAGNLFMQLVSEIAAGRFIAGQVRDKWSELDKDEYIRFVKKVIEESAKQDNVIIIGRGSQFILPHNKETIKILLVADMEDRIKFIMDHYELNETEAEKWILKEQQRRITLLRAFSSRRSDDPTLYTAVFNTSLVSLGNVEDLIAQLTTDIS